MLFNKNFWLVLSLFICFSINGFSQEVPNGLKPIKDIKTTSVKNQQRTGTCWCYSTISFLETEALRNNKGKFDLSEMYVVRNVYPEKAIRYFRRHGTANYSEGGQAHDVINAVKKHGLVPEKDFSGLNYNSDTHIHSEMVAITKGILDAAIKNKSKKISPKWKEIYDFSLNSYLGKAPEKITYNSKKYTPQQFAKDVVGFNAEDYIELTSYSHQPFYTTYDLDVPDNWSHDLYYNLPIDEFMEVMNYALKNNFSIVWDGDVSEKGFKHRDGLALLPFEKDKSLPQEKINQEKREATFEDWTSTDDHLMHLTGLFKDINGKLFYKTKNSWDTNSNDFGGYLYMSEPFVKLKTVAILIHKDAIPKKIAKKLNIK